MFDSETEKRIQRLTALIANGASGDFASFIDEQALALAQAEIVSSQIRAMRILQLESQVSEGESMSAMARIKNREHLRRALPLLLSMERSRNAHHRAGGPRSATFVTSDTRSKTRRGCDPDAREIGLTPHV